MLNAANYCKYLKFRKIKTQQITINKHNINLNNGKHLIDIYLNSTKKHRIPFKRTYKQLQCKV